MIVRDRLSWTPSFYLLVSYMSLADSLAAGVDDKKPPEQRCFATEISLWLEVNSVPAIFSYRLDHKPSEESTPAQRG